MSPLLDSGSHGLRPVRNPLISGALQQRGKKLLVEPDSHNRAGPPPDWGPPRSRTGQLLKVVTSLSLVSPSLDLLVRDGFAPQQMFTHINSVYEIIDAFSNKQPPRAARVLYTIIIAISSLIQAMPIKLAQRRSSPGCPSKKQP